MATIEEIIKDINSSNETESFYKIHEILSLKKESMKVLAKVIQLITPRLKSEPKESYARRIWDFITNSFFDETRKTHEYFQMFIYQGFSTNEIRIIEYNLNVAYAVLENSDETDNFILSEIFRNVENQIDVLTSVLMTKDCNSPLVCKFVDYCLLPQVFSKLVSLSDKREIVDFILNFSMGFFTEQMPAEMKTKLKDNIMNIYLLEIAPENEVPEWWNYCKLLIHYCGKFLHNEIELTNAILRRVEFGFKAKIVESRSGSYECWMTLIQNYNEDPKYLRSSKQITLLLKPLKARLSRSSAVSMKRFDAFSTFIALLENSSAECLYEFLNFCFGPFGVDYQRPCDLANHYYSGRLTQGIYPRGLYSLLRLIGHECQVQCWSHFPSWADTPNSLKQFLTCDNVNEHGKIFIDSITVSSLLLSEFMVEDIPKQQFIECLWTTLFSIIEGCNDISLVVLRSILSNVTIIVKAILTYNLFYNVINVIVNLVVNYIAHSNYDVEIYKEFVSPLIQELYSLELKVPGKIEIDCTVLFNYNKDGLEFYKSIKSFYFLMDSPPHSSFTVNLFECTVINMGCQNKVLDERTKNAVLELMIWLLDNDSEICVDVWKKSITKPLLLTYPEIKQHLINTIKQLMLIENPLKNINILKILELFLKFITKKDQMLVNDIIVSMRYSILTLPKQEICDNINILQRLVDIKWKMYFDNHSVFCIIFMDLIKQKVFSALPIFKSFIMKLSPQERQEVSKLSLQGVLSSLVKSENEDVSSDATTILKLLKLENTTPKTFFSRGAKIRNMATAKSVNVISPNPRRNFDLNELSDADFVKIDAEVFVDPNKMSEHQKEVASRRREDIPALYEDLTQSSMDSTVVQLEVNGVEATEEGEDRKRKRDEEAKVEVGKSKASEEDPRNKRAKSDLVPLRRNSLLSKNISTPISNRTQKMFDRPLMTNQTKLKDKSPNTSIHISDVKVVLSRKPIQMKLEAMNYSANETADTNDCPNKKEAEEMIKNENQVKPALVKKKPEPTEEKEKESITENGVKESKKKGADKSFSRLSTHKTHEPLEEDKGESDANKEVKKKRGRPLKIKPLILLSECSKEDDSLQNINDKEEADTNKDAVKKRRGRPRRSSCCSMSDCLQESNVTNKKCSASNADPATPQPDSVKLPETETEILQNGDASENSQNTDLSNIPDEDNSKENSKSSGKRVTARALTILKMNIVGGDEFQNLPRKRNSSSAHSFRQNVDTKRTKLIESNRKTKEKIIDENNKSNDTKNNIEDDSESDKKADGVSSEKEKSDSNKSVSVKHNDVESVETKKDLEENKNMRTGEKKKIEDLEKDKIAKSEEDRQFPHNRNTKTDNSDTTNENTNKNYAVAVHEITTRRRSVAKRLQLEHVDVKKNVNEKTSGNKKVGDEKNELRLKLESARAMKHANDKKLNPNQKLKLDEESVDVKKNENIRMLNVNTKLDEMVEADGRQVNDKPLDGEKKIDDKQKMDDRKKIDDQKKMVDQKTNMDGEKITNTNKKVIANCVNNDEDVNKKADGVKDSKETPKPIKNEISPEDYKTVIFDKKLGKIVEVSKSLLIKNKINEGNKSTVASIKVNELNVSNKISSNDQEGGKSEEIEDTFTVTARSDTKSGICLTIKKLSPEKMKKAESPTLIESSLEEDSQKFRSPTSSNKKSTHTSAYLKINDVRVALFRNNFDELSPDKIKEISNLNDVSPSKDEDTETMEFRSQDSAVKVSEAETETMNITGDVSDVSLKLVIEKTPERKETLASSPVSHDTPTRNNELMNNTFDISPIKNDGKKQDGKESPDIFASQKEPTQDIDLKDLDNDISSKADDVLPKKSETEIATLKAPSSRSAKLLNLVPQAPPIKTHRSILDPITCTPQVSSPTTERIKRMMMNCEEQNQAESLLHNEEATVIPFITGKDILKFEKEVPSPLATPKVSILKRKLPDVLEDGLSPCAKRKRVNFSDPPTTSEKIYFKEIEEKFHFKKMKRNKHKLHTHTNNEQKNSDLIFDDIRPLIGFSENTKGIFQFVGQPINDAIEIVQDTNGMPEIVEDANGIPDIVQGTNGMSEFVEHINVSTEIVQDTNGSTEIVINKGIVDDDDVKQKGFPQVSSSTTERIKQMMLGGEQNLQETRDEVDTSVSKYEKQVLSPLATLKISIHKRNFSPSSKRKRVNFSDPPTTSEKIYFKETEEKSMIKGMKKKLHCKMNNHSTSEVSQKLEPLLNGIEPLDVLVVGNSDMDRVFQFTGEADAQAHPQTEDNGNKVKVIDDVVKESNEREPCPPCTSVLFEGMCRMWMDGGSMKSTNEEFVNILSDFIKKNLSATDTAKLYEQISKTNVEKTSSDECTDLTTERVKTKVKTDSEESTNVTTGSVQDDKTLKTQFSDILKEEGQMESTQNNAETEYSNET